MWHVGPCSAPLNEYCGLVTVRPRGTPSSVSEDSDDPVPDRAREPRGIDRPRFGDGR